MWKLRTLNTVADYMLQRGRAQLSAECGGLVFISYKLGRLQRGRAQLSAECTHGVVTHIAIKLLQRGRAQLSAECRSSRVKNVFDLSASTGPRSIERGMFFEANRKPGKVFLLQRGRAQLSAEWIDRRSARAPILPGFNGAALN